MQSGVDARDWHLGILDLEVTAWFEDDEGAGYDLAVVAETAKERPLVGTIEFCVLVAGFFDVGDFEAAVWWNAESFTLRHNISL